MSQVKDESSVGHPLLRTTSDVADKLTDNTYPERALGEEVALVSNNTPVLAVLLGMFGGRRVARRTSRRTSRRVHRRRNGGTSWLRRRRKRSEEEDVPLWRCPACGRVEPTLSSGPRCSGTPENLHRMVEAQPIPENGGFKPSDDRRVFT